MSSYINYIRYFIPAICLSLFFSCTEQAGNNQTLVLLSGEETGVTFNNRIDISPELNPINYIYVYNGSGLGVGDFNNDGLQDLFFAGNIVGPKLYLNKGNLHFEDVAETAGITKKGWATGVSVVDINADGYKDIYVCMADKDYGTAGENALYINQQDGTFREEAAKYGLNDSGYSTQAVFFDYDKDGDLDMYLLTNGIESFSHNNLRPIKKDGSGVSTDRLYRNNGDDTFTNVSADAGITIEGYGLGIGLIDINDDGWLDVYCANDFITNDLLWVNNGDGTFTESIRKFVTQTSYNGMGLDISDINNDGLLDVVEADMLPESNYHNKTMTPSMKYNSQIMQFNLGYMPQYVRNTLQVQNARHTFAEVGRLAGIHKTDWSWAPLIADFDNDGLRDLFISNGYGKDVTDLDYTSYSDLSRDPFGTPEVRKRKAYESLKKLPEINIPNYIYKNQGGLAFKDVSATWTTPKNSISNGAVYVDLDNDGDLEIVTNNLNQEAFLYKNTTRENDSSASNYLKVHLKGSPLNPDAIGAKLTLYGNGWLQEAMQQPVRGYVSSVDNDIHFGLGSTTEIDSIRVIWPDGKKTLVEQTSANQTLTIAHNDAENKRADNANLSAGGTGLLKEVTSQLNGIDHRENPFVDFQGQPLLLQMQSREGPAVAVADINSDQTEEILVTSALNDTSFVYFQEDGKVTKKVLLPDSWKHEQLGAVFIDVNKDGLQDIYVVSGGNEIEDERLYEDVLYIQQNDGSFEVETDKNQKLLSSKQTINAADFDNDGDLDLFIGTRLKHLSYPLSERSYLLENREGSFYDVTARSAPEFENLGMVTAALWTDFNNDGKSDLIVVGRWMALRFFENDNGKLKDVTPQTGINNLSGFWNSIQGADFDNDGDIDYIVGNTGLNTELKASKEEPVTILAKDFDGNDRIDPIIGYYVQGEHYPLPSRDALIGQISKMKKRFPYYKDYASTKFEEVFSPQELEGATKKQVNEMQSIYIENLGNNKFKYQPLPMEAQKAPVYGMSIADINGDTYNDVLLVGNRRDSEIISGYLDGSHGSVLLGDGKGGFTPLSKSEISFFVPGEARGIAKMVTDGKLFFLVANNDSKMQLFQALHNKKVLNIRTDETWAYIQLSDDSRYMEEFYNGAGYLSVDSRKLLLPKNTKKVEIYNAKGEKRVFNARDLSM